MQGVNQKHIIDIYFWVFLVFCLLKKVVIKFIIQIPINVIYRSWKMKVLIIAVLSVYTCFFVAFYHKIECVSLWQLDQHKLKLLSDRTINQNELRKKLGQLLYLQNLAKVRLYNYYIIITVWRRVHVNVWIYSYLS